MENHNDPEPINIGTEYVVIVNFNGRLGNNIFQYCFGRILATELGYKLASPSIEGFVGTQGNIEGKSLDTHPLNLDGHVVDLRAILHNQQDRQIVLGGYFQRYEYYKNYQTEIRKWMDIDYYDVGQTENDIIVHVRLGDTMTEFSSKHTHVLPFSYYEKALSNISFDKVYICSDPETISSEYIRQFDKYDPIILRGSGSGSGPLHVTGGFGAGPKSPQLHLLEDFRAIRSFSKIIIAQSTFSWWGAFLSNASEIFVPVPRHNINNRWSTYYPDIALFVDDDDRYKYIKQFGDKWENVNIAEEIAFRIMRKDYEMQIG